ncbi:unnamed protein product [Ceutorhynchus assimilis]|uniref:DUF4806 domain-containing protein n=1 Tax=Ceutorhynchus assimilis TaxID=467358 RepID=A0A9P0DGW5_9CUCU|nr:unnamed protein product [Ceutorhynchus assimilis]
MNVKLSCMQAEISRLTYMVTNINRAVTKEKVELDDFGVIFPLMSTDQLDILEQLLNDPEKYNNLVEYIKQIGGGHLNDITHRAMQRIMGNCLGSMFSWLGQKGKIALRPFKIASVFKESILVSSRKIERNTTERDVEKAIMQWLRQAPQRYKRVML